MKKKDSNRVGSKQIENKRKTDKEKAEDILKRCKAFEAKNKYELTGRETAAGNKTIFMKRIKK